jgi:aspartate kinase/aspartokinase/homoserine dehydrogenase 1
MSKIVVKFGGSNLKTRSDLKKILKVVKSYKKPLVIVVSAFYGITDFLSSKISGSLETKEAIEIIIEELKKHNREIVGENITDLTYSQKALLELDGIVNQLEKFLLGVHYIGEVPEFLEDQILSFGEKISSVLLHNLLESKGMETELVFPEDLPLITDGEFGNASVDFDACELKIKSRLTGEKIYVIPGFYGVSHSGKTTLLGKGGSDYSAASIARCIDADYLDIWKDVNGFMTADPKLVEHPRRLDKITYAEAAELAYFGAKILHPRTVEPLMDAHIPVRIFNINGLLDQTRPVSWVNSEEVVLDGVVKSVTYSDEFCVVKLKGPGVGLKPGVLAKVAGKLSEEKININSVITSQIAINLLLHKKDKNSALHALKKLGLHTVMDVQAIDDVSVIAIVGQGMLDNYGVAARIFTAAARVGINIKISSTGASQVVSYIVVDRENRNNAVREIHNEFFKIN